ncbi:MAG: iron chelate uptake ABC transporter family permease subunit [Planctomycetota bacterium]
MLEMIPILQWAFLACLILVGIHCYLGLHIVSRGVIFVDLALAQVAALGSAVAVLLGYELNSQTAYIISLGFAFLGAAVFGISRAREEKIPQEAIIGIVFAVSSAAAILILDRAPHGGEAIKSMLVGGLLYVTPLQILKIFLIYLAIGVFHYIFRRKFLLISTNIKDAYEQGLSVRWWDFLFYLTFGIIVTSSVQVGGVLLVFSYLIVPAVCAMLFAECVVRRLVIGWVIGLAVSVAGLYFSALWDLPTGASIVTVFGFALIISVLIRRALGNG